MPVPVMIVSNPPAAVAQPLPPQHIVYVSDGVAGRNQWKGKGKGKAKGVLQVVPPLHVRSIWLPREAMDQRGDVNFFAIDITSEDSAVASPWRVMRRYNEFKTLADRLGSQAHSFPDAPFPGKHMFGCTGQTLENRRRGLEVWLQRVFEHPASKGAWIGPLRDFVGAGQAPYTPTVPSSAPSAPDSAVLTTPQESRNEECELLEIEVPPGVSAGQFLGVAVPDGRQLTLALPSGVSVGDTLLVVHDPVTDTLRLSDSA
jgi:hypothetical protein